MPGKREPLRDQDWNTAEQLLSRWLKRAREGQHSHQEAGKLLRRAYFWLAVPVIVITTSLGTAAFAVITKDVGSAAKAWFGGFSMLAAVLAALQTQLHLLERSEKHRGIGARYGSVRRQLEAILAMPVEERGMVADTLEGFREKLDAIGAEADAVSRSIFEKTRRILAEDDRRGW